MLKDAVIVNIQTLGKQFFGISLHFHVNQQPLFPTLIQLYPHQNIHNLFADFAVFKYVGEFFIEKLKPCCKVDIPVNFREEKFQKLGK